MVMSTDGVSVVGGSQGQNSLLSDSKEFVGNAGRGFGLGAMGVSYQGLGPVSDKLSMYLRTFGRVAGGLTIGLDYMAYRDGQMSGGRFMMNSTFTGVALYGGPIGFVTGTLYYVMGDLLGGHERGEQMAREIRARGGQTNHPKSLARKIKRRNPKF